MLTLETTSEQRTSLGRQIPDFQRQVEVRQNDLQMSNQKRHAVYEKAVEVLQEKTVKEIEKFCSRSSAAQEVEVICSAVLVITEGIKYPESGGDPGFIWNHFKSAFVQEDWRQQFYQIDPESHGTVTSFFLERRFKELRKLGLKRANLAKEEPLADALLELCEGFLEIINTVEERIELESRLKVYEEMFSNMRSEVERLHSSENTLKLQVENLNTEMASLEASMKKLEVDIAERKGRLEMAQEVASSLERQRRHWTDQLNDLQAEKKILEERETVLAAAAVYLMELPMSQRVRGLEVIHEAAECVGSYMNMGKIFDPCDSENILVQKLLPGWSEKLIKRLCVVYDPHNVLMELFSVTEVKLHYIESLEDLDEIKGHITGASANDVLVFNFGSSTHIIFTVVEELKAMCSKDVAVFLCISQWIPLPSRTTFVSLEMSGHELRRMASHLFKLNEGEDQRVAEKTRVSDELESKVSSLEDKLVKLILSEDPLAKKHMDIVKLSSSLDDAKSTRKESMIALQEEVDHSMKTVVTARVFPTAIIAACCDMVTILGRPLMSLSQFVHFSQARLKDESLGEEDAHKIIFQRYCLAFSDKDQLLFQTFIILHLKLMAGTLEEVDFSDFVNLIGGHERKDFPLKCPDWCLPSNWEKLNKILSEKNYHLATRTLEDNEEEWKKWYDDAFNVGPQFDNFSCLLVMCALRPKLLATHLKNFILREAPASMEVPANLCLDYVHSFSTSISPILLFIDDNAIEDPTFHLKKLADVQGIASTKVKYFALGAGNGATACSLLDTAFVRGQWLIFQVVSSNIFLSVKTH